MNELLDVALGASTLKLLYGAKSKRPVGSLWDAGTVIGQPIKPEPAANARLNKVIGRVCLVRKLGKTYYRRSAEIDGPMSLRKITSISGEK